MALVKYNPCFLISRVGPLSIDNSLQPLLIVVNEHFFWVVKLSALHGKQPPGLVHSLVDIHVPHIWAHSNVSQCKPLIRVSCVLQLLLGFYNCTLSGLNISDIKDIVASFTQFDNFKRVFKVVEELKGPLVENVKHHFLLSNSLARWELSKLRKIYLKWNCYK